MTDEEPGLLGNLPRSRPGTRSDKRSAKGTAAAKQPAAAKKRTAPPKKPRPAAPPKNPPAAPAASNPLESAVKVAGAGLRVAEGVTREVLRRLPRP